MFINKVIEDMFINLVNDIPINLSTGNYFNYFPEAMYDPNLDFDNKIRSYLVSNDQSKEDPITKYTNMYNNKDWLGFVWNRSTIQESDLQQREFDYVNLDPINYKGDLYKYSLAKVNINIALFSNSLSYIEDYEELFFQTYKKTHFTQVEFPIMGFCYVAWTEISLGDINKLDRQDKGTIVELPISMSITFPIVKLIQANKPVIGLDSNNKPKIKVQYLLSVD